MIRLQDQLMNEILGVTMMIQKKFSERYHLLGETPLFLSDNGKGIYIVDFEQYLESITTQLTTFEEAIT
ncbi:MAG: hypothetical protein IPJ74_12860 [Saprospiraceae bacterium]|nr:hypothetical protein [Saprospiraceae bacterium]